mmetsp:Transcript_3080/g.6778  ORF Transcript_3080/g.6778 Transcript_3080/m.6778 type:complete len:83 (+) Transcript_3080:118-366(+)
MGAREDQDSSSMGASATTRSELLTVNENDWDGATPKREASFGVTLALEDHAAIVAVDTHYSNLSTPYRVVAAVTSTTIATMQ